MKPTINGTKFGSITVDGETYDHDIVIRLRGKVKKRKKKLSKQQYGTSHTVSLAEAEHIYDDGAERVIVGTGQHGVLKLSEEAVGPIKPATVADDSFWHATSITTESLTRTARR